MSKTRDKANTPLTNFESTGIDDNATSTAVTVDSSGNVLVGKTSTDLGTAGTALLPSGVSFFTRNGDKVLRVNRLTSDGDIIDLLKDGTTVGSIGSSGGNYLTIGNNVNTRLRFTASDIRPCNNDGSDRDNAVDLGDNVIGARFKDLYLGGTITLGDGHQLGDETIYDNLVIKSSTDEHIVYSSGGTGVHIFKTGSTSLDNGSERMRIDNSGNVGIGTSSPSANLDIRFSSTNTSPTPNNANLRLLQTTGGANGYFSSINLGTSTVGDGADSLIVSYGITNGQSALAFFTDNLNTCSERMRIDQNGNVGIGTSSPGKKLEVQGTSSNNTTVLLVENNNSSTFNSVVSEIRGGRSTTNGSYYLFWGANGNSSGIFRILDSGNAQNTNNSYGGTSDLKLKENIVDANSQWEDIKALPIKKYSFKLENSEIPTQIGVIAQDLETAGMNGLVEETVDRDEDGNDLGTTTKSVKYSVLYMKAVKALQEALIEIDNLKARVNTLEGN